MGIWIRDRRRTRAGTSAAHEFELRRARWRRRVRTSLGLVITGWVLLGAATAWVFTGLIEDFAIGLIGFAVGIGLWVWDEPPEYIERWRRGADGEKQTARALGALPDGWVVVHDVDRGTSNWDHVVAGPAGVFLLDSKNLLGDATVENGVLTLRRHHAPEETARFARLAGQMRGAAVALGERLQTAELGRPWVTGVVVVWPSMHCRPSTADRVTYVAGNDLVGWLLHQPRLRGAQRARQVAEAIPAALGDAAHSPAP